MNRSRMRASLGLALGAALLMTGVAATPSVAAEVGTAPPPGITADRVTNKVDDVVVSAKISLPPGGDVVGSVTGTLAITHNGSSAAMRSGRMTMIDPEGRSLTGAQFVASGTANTWTSTVQLPADVEPGTFEVSVNAEIDVTTTDGVVKVPIRTADPVLVPFRAKRNIPLIWTSTSSAPAGSTISVHGAANIRSLGTGDYAPATDQEVKLYFDPSGDAPERFIDTLTTDDRGYFTTRQKPGASGKWRAEMPMTDTGAKAVWTLTSAERARDTTLREGTVTATDGGFTAGDHLMTHDVVLGLAPVQRRVDVGSLDFTVGGTSGWLSAESRRGEGNFPDGYRVQRDLTHSGLGTSHATFTFNPTLPAGIYDIGIRDEMKACSAPDWDGLEGGTSNCTHNVLVEDPTVTTIVVKRASTTTVAASRTSVPTARTITLSGDVERVQLVSTGGAAIRPAPNVAVKVYFDPAGSAAPVLKKEVTTGSDGSFSTSVRATTSGKWIAKYAGTSLVAPSEAGVNVSVG
ncbi:hypothetical protein [Promicromonospora sukumoe]|uniref:hypothetical protein n=1 Tax=Promicromonospora sukumoe TaxID=88382 RepID=UPI0003AB473B|nr:hypothetical protein [Promicromonospora sukumoe]